MRVAPLIQTAIAAMAIGTLAACATPGLRADVSRFQSQLPVPQGQTFAIEARDPNLRGGIEFSQYAALVSEELARFGYRPAAAGTKADLVVKFNYGVDNGRERVRSSGFGGYGFGYGGFGGYSGYGFGGPLLRTRRGFIYARGFYDPFLFGGYGYNDTYSYTVYTSGIDLTIERADTGERVFEGSAEAMSRTKDLVRLVPNLIEAMFTDFPGNSGEKVKITIAPPEQN
jgi:hypothetical protein